MDSLPAVEVCREGFWPLCDAEALQPADVSHRVLYTCDVGERERLRLGTGWPAEKIRQDIQFSRSVLYVERVALQFERPTHQFGILVAHGFDVAER